MTYDPAQPAHPEPTGPTYQDPAVTPVAPVAAGPTKAVQPPAKAKGSPAWVNVVLAIAVGVAIGGVAFAVGRSTAPSTAAAGGNGRPGFGNGNFEFPRGSGAPGLGGGAFGGRNGGPVLTGTVESIDGSNLTIKTASGQTVQVTLDSSTTYSTNSPATQSDVTTGANVQVRVAFDGGGFGNGNGAAASGPLGTANSVTVVP